MVAVVWVADHIVVSLAGLVTLCAVAIVAGGPPVKCAGRWSCCGCSS